MESHSNYVAIAGDRFEIRPLVLLLGIAVIIGLFVWLVDNGWSKYVSMVAYGLLVVVSFFYGYKNKYQTPLRRMSVEIIAALIGIALLFWVSSSDSHKAGRVQTKTRTSSIVLLLYTIIVALLWIWSLMRPPLGFVSRKFIKENPEDKMNSLQLMAAAVRKRMGFRI